MNDIRKALFAGLSSRILVIAVFVMCGLFFTVASDQPAIHQPNPLPVVNLFNRYDSGFYTGIAMNGYPIGYPNINFWKSAYFNAYVPNPVLAMPEWAFFPLYPAAIRAVSFLFNPFLSALNAADLAGFIVSNVAFFFAVFFFYKLTEKIFKASKMALLATVFFSFYAGAVFYSAIYTEALFMALALGAFYFLEKEKLPIAVLLGFLASLTRSDGLLVCIPFLVYALQSLKDKPKAIRLGASSVLVASPFLIFQIAGYFLAGHVFPVSVLAHNLNFEIYPPITTQLIQAYHWSVKTFAFDMIGIAVILIPTAYFVYSLFSSSFRSTLIKEANQLKYWAFYASLVFVIVFQSNVSSVIRYSGAMLPVYWVSALIFRKNRKVGIVLFVLMLIMFIVGSYTFETGGAFF